MTLAPVAPVVGTRSSIDQQLLEATRIDADPNEWESGHNEDLFDYTPGYDEEVGIRLAGGLSPEDTQRATILYNLFNALMGLCVVVGDPGSGKDLLGNYLTYRLKRYFPTKRILRDEKPRPVFGPYAGLFNPQVLAGDLERMCKLAAGAGANRIDAVLDKAAEDWATTGRGSILLKYGILYLTELWRYCYNREPHNPMNKTMGAVFKTKRHLDLLTIGTIQLPSELDKKTCLPWIDWRATCTRSRINKTRFTYFIEKVKYDKRLDLLISVSRPFAISIDAGRPRRYIGDGRIVIKKPNYRPETEEERIILDVLKAGVDTFEELVDTLRQHGDMTEWEILETIKTLKFSLRKRAIDYPCDFSVYNSKSAPQIKTSVKVGD